MAKAFPYKMLFILALSSLSLLNAAQAQPSPQSFWTPANLNETLAEILNTCKGDAAREPPLGALFANAESYLDDHQDSATAWSVTARIRFWFADTQSLLTGLALMEQARDELITAIDIDPMDQQGSAQAFLGLVYFAVPLWPMSFRNKKKSADYFKQALAISDSSLSNNYLYAQVLIWQKQYPEARQRLDNVRNALDRTELPDSTRSMYLDGIKNMQQELDSL